MAQFKIFFGQVSIGVPSPTTLDPAKTSSLITLTNGNLTAEKTSAGAPNLYASSFSFASGGDLMYVEVTATPHNNFALGISNTAIGDSDAAGTDNWMGWDTNSMALWLHTAYHGGLPLSSPMATPPSAGDVIGIYVNRTGAYANQIWFYNITKNEWTPAPGGDGHSIAALGAGPLYFGFTLTDGQQATVNFDGPFVSSLYLAAYSKWDGTPASSVTHYTLAAATGTFTLTGIAADTRAARKLAVTSGTFALTGIAASTKYARKLVAIPGAFLLSGAATVLRTTQVLSAQVRATLLTGVDVILKHRRMYIMTAATSAVTLTGLAVILRKTGAAVLLAATGAFALTGIAAVTRASRRLTAASGAIALTGIAANLVATVARRLLAETGALLLTGNVANLVYAAAVDYEIEALTGNFVMTWRGAELSVWRRPPPPQMLQFGRPVPIARRW